jgi:hypothetical protein
MLGVNMIVSNPHIVIVALPPEARNRRGLNETNVPTRFGSSAAGFSSVTSC